MWNTSREEAIARGNLLHEILGQLITQEQIAPLTHQLEKITTHPLIKEYYTKEYIVYNEREWLDISGEYLRPDRVAYHKPTQRAVIIDYKTGEDHPQYQAQLRRYAQTLEQTGWEVTQFFLVFINEEIRVISL